MYAAASAVPAPVIPFGGLKETCAPNIIMHCELDRYAVDLHRMYSQKTGSRTTWESLPPFLKASNRASADHLPTKLRLLLHEDTVEMNRDTCRRAADAWRAAPDPEPFRRNEHERWLRFHLLYNWRCGPAKDEQKRTHPCMVPYDSLSREDQEKDDSAWQLIESVYTGKEETA